MLPTQQSIVTQQAAAICQQIKTLSWAQAKFPSLQHPRHTSILDLQMQLNALLSQFPALSFLHCVQQLKNSY